MNGWSGESMTDNGDGTYTSTFELVVGDTVEYKFQNGLDNWEDNVPSECSLGGFGNRFVVVGDMDMSLDLVCFDQCDDCIVAARDLEFSAAISISPNPAKYATNLLYDFDQATDLKINLMNNLGQRIENLKLESVQSGNYSISLDKLASGVYFIHITDGESSVVQKLIVE